MQAGAHEAKFWMDCRPRISQTMRHSCQQKGQRNVLSSEQEVAALDKSALIQRFTHLLQQLLEPKWFTDKASCTHFNGFFCGGVSR